MSDQQIARSRLQLQAKHDQGGCNCLLAAQKECLFLPSFDHDEQQDDELDGQWNPLIGYLQHPNLVYNAQDILRPVLNYMQERQVDRVLRVQDIKIPDIFNFYHNVWNTENWVCLHSLLANSLYSMKTFNVMLIIVFCTFSWFNDETLMRIILCFQIIGREKDDVIIRVKWQVMPSLDGAGRGASRPESELVLEFFSCLHHT